MGSEMVEESGNKKQCFINGECVSEWWFYGLSTSKVIFKANTYRLNSYLFRFMYCFPTFTCSIRRGISIQ